MDISNFVGRIINRLHSREHIESTSTINKFIPILYTRVSRKSSILREFIVKYWYGYGKNRKKDKRNSYGAWFIATKIWCDFISIARYDFSLGKRQKCTNHGIFDCHCNTIRSFCRLYFMFNRILSSPCFI